jgi:hypothetical protein
MFAVCDWAPVCIFTFRPQMLITLRPLASSYGFTYNVTQVIGVRGPLNAVRWWRDGCQGRWARAPYDQPSERLPVFAGASAPGESRA